MSVVVERTPGSGEVWSRQWTLDDLAALPDDLPTGPALYEVWEGELRLTAPPGDVHGSVLTRIATVLTVHGEWEGLGRVSGGDVGVVLELGPPLTCVGADVVFLTADQLPAQHSPQGYLITIPALMVEVRSKNDRRQWIAPKVERYLQAGVRLVWIVDEKARTITVYRPGVETLVLTDADMLTAEGVVPGLQFPVRRLFEDLQ